MAEAVSRAGFAALLGRPNAGKSTLLNRLLGEKLAIVTARPQTTRSRLLGIAQHGAAQILLLDTPGVHAGIVTVENQSSATSIAFPVSLDVS